MTSLPNSNNSFVNCSFCKNRGHDIRSCDSPLIYNIQQSVARTYIENIYLSILLQLNDADTEWRFVDTLVSRFLLAHIRVLAVTAGVARASGFTKSEYAKVIYRLYSQIFTNFAYNTNTNDQHNDGDGSNNDNINGYVRNLIEQSQQH